MLKVEDGKLVVYTDFEPNELPIILTGIHAAMFELSNKASQNEKEGFDALLILSRQFVLSESQSVAAFNQCANLLKS
ncbi:hypothetical protein AB832_02265 [Flavobacteriaceae bacterium (ex Bugula neritina AB1)]|nr:hypothetical protein AB832_02265 [Flavobacteriaceae bacterium (ex Bugula neritina AB1)]